MLGPTRPSPAFLHYPDAWANACRPGNSAAEPELLLDPQQPVVLRDAVRARGGAGLDLAGAGGDREVGDRRVLGLAGAVGDHGRVAGLAGDADRLEGLGQGADLVDLDQDRVADAELDAAPQPLGVGDEEVVADQLDPRSPSRSVSSFQPSQSSSSMPSSIETTG